MVKKTIVNFLISIRTRLRISRHFNILKKCISYFYGPTNFPNHGRIF